MSALSFSVFALPPLFSAAVTVALLVRLWRCRNLSRARPFLLLLSCSAVWTLAYGLDVLLANPEAMLLTSKLAYVGIVGVPPAFLCIALEATGRRSWLTPTRVRLFIAHAAIVLALVLTNELHGLIWSDVRLDPSSPFPALMVSHGPWFWVHAIVANLCIVGGSVLLVRKYVRAWNEHRAEAVALLASVSAPWIGNVLYLTGLTGSLDLTSSGFGVSAVALSWGLLRHDVLDIRPAARHAIQEALTDGIIVVDTRGQLLDCNRAARDLLSLPHLRATGQPIRDDLGQYPELLEMLCGERVTSGVLVLDSATKTRHLDVRVSEVKNRLQQVIARAGVLRDITHWKDLEVQMQQTQKLESLGVLAGGIAHDFNNILTGVLGNTELALMELPKDTPAQRPLEQVRAAAERAAELCSQMLAYAGKGILDVRKVDLSDLVHGLAPLLAASMSKKARVVYDLERPIRAIKGDRSQLGQLVMNLVINAAEALDDKDGEVVVSTRLEQVDSVTLAAGRTGQQLDPGPYIVLEVRDDGCGMDADTVERVFEPFFTTKFTGRGLGLAVLLGVARAHHGTVTVDTGPGRGTTFRVFLPALAETVESTAAVTKPSIDTGRTTGTMLVIDDEDHIRELVSSTMQHHGLTVYTAPDGRTGLDRLRSMAGKIDVVLLDLTMPGLSGHEVYARLKVEQPMLPVVIMSGYSQAVIEASFPDDSPDEFLTKPFKLADLTGAIARSMAYRSAPISAPSDIGETVPQS